MTRVRIAFLLLIVLCSCGTPAGTKFPFPTEVGADWRLSNAPAEARSESALPAETGVQEVWAAQYRGPGDPIVLAHAMKTSSSAFESQQKWRPESGTIALQHGIFFLVVRSSDLGQAELIQFARDLEKRAFPGQ
jgi:hypothetical protein